MIDSFFLGKVVRPWPYQPYRFLRHCHESASVFSTSHDPTNGKPNAAVSQRTPRGQPGSESLKENGGRRASKRKYTTSFTPEDRARIGKYASKNVNAAAVKKFKATHEIGEGTIRTCQGQATPIHALGVWLARAHRNAFIRFAM